MRIASVATAYPPYRYPQALITEALQSRRQENPGECRLRDRLHSNCGVEYRHLMFPIDNVGMFSGFGESNDAWIERPGTSAFLSWLMNDDGAQGHGHRVMVWSSARPPNVDAMVKKLFTPDQRAKLVAKWSRDELGLTREQYNNKVQVYKELQKIWSDSEIKKTHPSGKAWTQSNTVLIDDSIKKAASEPYNLVEVEEFENKPWQKNDDALKRVRDYLEELAMWNNVSNYMKDAPFKSPSG